MIPSVNFHLWEPCNMRCKFCFATFQDVKKTILPKGHLSKEKAIEVVEQLAEIGFEKITFAGGEPTLCPWLPELIAIAKGHGLTTMIVTNGSRLSDSFLAQNVSCLDWIALSVDSIEHQTNLLSGRAITGKQVLSEQEYHLIANKVKSFGYGLKINTVVHRYNYTENLTALIKAVKPKRWKLLQALPIKGENDRHIAEFAITKSEFQQFLDRHIIAEEYTSVVVEDNEKMKGSYAMVDPAGRFFNNMGESYNYSKPIQKIGSRFAIQQMNYSFSKFFRRKGLYDWVLD